MTTRKFPLPCFHNIPSTQSNFRLNAISFQRLLGFLLLYSQSQKSSLRSFLRAVLRSRDSQKSVLFLPLSLSITLIYFHILQRSALRHNSKKSVLFLPLSLSITSIYFRILKCSVPRHDSKKSVLFRLPQLCFHHPIASLPKRFSKVCLIRGRLKSIQCHHSPGDRSLSIQCLNVFCSSIMLPSPLTESDARCLSFFVSS